MPAVGGHARVSRRQGGRDFLKSLSAVALAGPAVARLQRVEEVFAAELDGVFGRATSSEEWAAIRDRYMLGPNVVYLNHASIGTMPRAVHEARAGYTSVCEAHPWLYMWVGAWEDPPDACRPPDGPLLGVAPDRLDDISEMAAKDPTAPSNPVPAGPEEMRAIPDAAMEGRTD